MLTVPTVTVAPQDFTDGATDSGTTGEAKRDRERHSSPLTALVSVALSLAVLVVAVAASVSVLTVPMVTVAPQDSTDDATDSGTTIERERRLSGCVGGRVGSGGCSFCFGANNADGDSGSTRLHLHQH